MSIHLEGLSKKFSNQVVLEDIDLSIPQNQIVSIVGASGCGKSTLLRLMAGLEEVDAGKVSVGADLRKSFVFQDPRLLEWRKVSENILLPLELSGQAADLSEVLRLTQLESHKDKYPSELSGGMKMRCSVARSLITWPELIFLDEPFGALDEMTREKLNLDLLKIHQSRPCTILLVTHNLSEAVFMSQRVIVLKDGKIAKDLVVADDLHRDLNFYNDDRYLAAVQELRQFMRED